MIVKTLRHVHGPQLRALPTHNHLFVVNGLLDASSVFFKLNDVQKIIFCIDVGGEFELHFRKSKIIDRVVKAGRWRDGTLEVSIDISVETVSLPEKEFRRVFSDLLLAGVDAVIARSERLRQPFDYDGFREIVDLALKCYHDWPTPIIFPKDVAVYQAIIIDYLNGTRRSESDHRSDLPPEMRSV